MLAPSLICGRWPNVFYHHVAFNSEYLLHQRRHFSSFFVLISLMITCFACLLTWIYGNSKTALVISFYKHQYFRLGLIYWCYFVIPRCKVVQSLRAFKFHTNHVCYTHKVSFPLYFWRRFYTFTIAQIKNKSNWPAGFGGGRLRWWFISAMLRMLKAMKAFSLRKKYEILWKMPLRKSLL